MFIFALLCGASKGFMKAFKEHLSNISSSVYEKVKEHEAESEKSITYIKNMQQTGHTEETTFFSENGRCITNKIRKNEWGLCMQQINLNGKFTFFYKKTVFLLKPQFFYYLLEVMLRFS